MLTLELLDPTRLCRDGTPLALGVKRTRALPVRLSRSGPLPRARVVALLWPWLDESRARRTLRHESAKLRESGAAGAVLVDGETLALAPTVAIDADAFASALAAGSPDDALNPWRCPPAGGLMLDDAQDSDDWLAAQQGFKHGPRGAGPAPLVPSVLPFVGHCWYLHHGERPRDVRSPDEYAGGPDLAIHGTQLELPASQQRKLVDLEPHEDT